MQKIVVLLLACATGFSAGAQMCSVPGHVHEKTAPYLSMHTDVRIHADQIYDADHADEEIFNLKTHAHTGLEFSPVNDLFVRSTLKLEQKHSHDHGGGGAGPDGKDTYFRNHMLFIEELKLVYTPGSWELFGGKFNPVAGLDQHNIPGYYGYEIEEEYSILGRLGAGAAYTLETQSFGDHRLEASGFCRDTTVLNQGIINSSGEPDHHKDGGIANTQDFSSWALALSGDAFYFAAGDTIHELDYVLAVARQADGHGADADHDDEDRTVIGGVYTATLTENLEFKGVGEFKNILNSHTHRGEDLRISTAGAGLSWLGWEMGGSYSFLDSHAEPDGEHIQTSLGYVWNCGAGLHGGWKLVEEEGEAQKSIGLMVSYHRHF